jgi:hypothetical protein
VGGARSKWGINVVALDQHQDFGGDGGMCRRLGEEVEEEDQDGR